MIEIRVKDEIVISKKLLLDKLSKACQEAGFTINSYYLTEYLDEKPIGYKLEFFENINKGAK